MDIKREMIYREDVLQVKPEPTHLSPSCATTIITKTINTNSSNNGLTINGLVTTLQQQQPGNVVGGIVTAVSNIVTNGVTATISNNGLTSNSNSGGPFSSLGAKRPRPDDWLSSPGSGGTPVSVTVAAAAGAPSSPVQTAHSFAVIGNGYHSPGSNGSYDPYSPTGKTGQSIIIYIFICTAC